MSVVLASTGLLPPLLADAPGLVLLLAVLAVLLTTFFVTVTMLAWRRRQRDAIRAIVSRLEALRDGDASPDPTGEPAVLDAEPAFRVVTDALERLERDLVERRARRAVADDRDRSLVAAAESRAVVATDLDGDVKEFSAGAERLFGWQARDVVGRPAAVLFDEAAYREFLPKLARRSLREQGIEERTRLVRRDGEPFDGHVGVRMLRDGERSPVGFLLMIEDVSERVRLERRSEEAEQRYRRLIDALGDGVGICRGGRLQFANPRLADLLGVPLAKMVGLEFRERVATGDVLVVEEALLRVEGDADGAETLRCRIVDATTGRAASVRLDLRSVDYGGAPAVLILAHDESVERRTERELHRNEARLDAVLEATADGVLVWVRSPVGPRVQMTNGAFLARFGLEASRVLGSGADAVAGMLRAGGHAAAAERLQALAREPREGRWDLEETTTGDDPGRRDLRLRVAALRGRRGEDFGWVLVFHDVGERRATERRLERQAEQAELARVELERAKREVDAVNRELAERAGRLDRINEELRHLDAMKSNLLGNVSHELQTPLVAIRGFTEMILKERLGPINEEQRRGLSLSLDNIDRLIGMIEGLLSFSRSEEEDRLRLTRFDLAEVIETSRRLMQPRADERGVRVECEVPPGRFELCADRDRIEQVLINVLSNAIKFNRDDGRVVVRARASDDRYVRIEVEDTGVGIPREDVSRIFERRYRAGSGAEGDDAPSGSGIGLAIVRDILRSHGCRIHVDSDPGEGTRVVFTLPLAGVAEAPDPSSGGVAGDATDASDEDAGEARAAGDGPAPRFRVIRRPAEDGNGSDRS